MSTEWLVAVQHMEHAQTSGSIELMVNVLTMGYWPTYIPMDVSLPEDVSASRHCMCAFVLVVYCNCSDDGDDSVFV